MTREEAIDIIRQYECCKEHIEACEMAISALEQQPCERFEWGIDGNVYKITKAKDGKEICQQVCKDAVSRKLAISAIKNLYPDIPRVDFNGAKRKWAEKYAQYIECERIIEQLPSVTVRQTGEWIDQYNDGNWHCSKCGAIVEKDEQINHNWYFCYHCGAKMIEPQEGEDQE